MAVTITVDSISPDLAAYRSDWDALFGSSMREPSTSFEWTDALTRSHLHAGDRLLLLRAFRNGRVGGLLPLVARRTTVFGVSVVLLSPLAELYGTHSDLLAEEMDADMVAAFLDTLFRLDERWDMFRMSRVLADHPLLERLSLPTTQRRLSVRIRNGEPSYFLALPESYEAYLAQRSSKFRNHLGRMTRKITSLASDVIELHEPSAVNQAVDMLMQVERASWKHGHGTAISAVPHQASFYRDLCLGAAAAGRLHLQFLRVEGQPVAYNLGYIAHESYAYLKTSVDEGFKSIGAATYLRAKLIERLIARGVRQVDFPAEPYEWESQWTDSVRWHKVVTIYGRTALGHVLKHLDHWRHRPGMRSEIRHADPRALQPGKPTRVEEHA